MGLGVAESFAVAGTAVRLTDVTPESTREAYERLMQRTRGHAEVGLLGTEAVNRAAAISEGEFMHGHALTCRIRQEGV